MLRVTLGNFTLGAILKLCVESLSLGAKRFYFYRKYFQNYVELKKKKFFPVLCGKAGHQPAWSTQVMGY